MLSTRDDFAFQASEADADDAKKIQKKAVTAAMAFLMSYNT